MTADKCQVGKGEDRGSSMIMGMKLRTRMLSLGGAPLGGATQDGASTSITQQHSVTPIASPQKMPPPESTGNGGIAGLIMRVVTTGPSTAIGPERGRGMVIVTGHSSQELPGTQVASRKKGHLLGDVSILN